MTRRRAYASLTQWLLPCRICAYRAHGVAIAHLQYALQQVNLASDVQKASPILVRFVPDRMLEIAIL